MACQNAIRLRYGNSAHGFAFALQDSAREERGEITRMGFIMKGAAPDPEPPMQGLEDYGRMLDNIDSGEELKGISPDAEPPMERAEDHTNMPEEMATKGKK